MTLFTDIHHPRMINPNTLWWSLYFFSSATTRFLILREMSWNHWMDCYDATYTHSWSPEDESSDCVDSLTFLQCWQKVFGFEQNVLKHLNGLPWHPLQTFVISIGWIFIKRVKPFIPSIATPRFSVLNKMSWNYWMDCMTLYSDIRYPQRIHPNKLCWSLYFSSSATTGILILREMSLKNWMDYHDTTYRLLWYPQRINPNIFCWSLKFFL